MGNESCREREQRGCRSCPGNASHDEKTGAAGTDGSKVGGMVVCISYSV